MLVQFKFKNFGPFRDEAIIDMRAIRAYKEHPYNLIVERGNNHYLKYSAIYGANASGKSNFVEAYDTFLTIVQWSFSKNDKHSSESVLSSYYKPYLFDDAYVDSDTEFEGIFHNETAEYRYGFSYNRDRITYEWLYKKTLETGRQVKIFERSEDDGIVLGSSVKRACEKYLLDIDDDVLALSFFSSLKLRTHVFKEALLCITSILPVSGMLSKLLDENLNRTFFNSKFDDDEKKQLLSFLSAIDVGIKDITVEKSNNNIAVYTYHTCANKDLRKVPIEIESDGTRKAISIYSLFRTAISENYGLIIDELNTQLHPILVKYLVDLFSTEATSGQLIYTTHDTTMLDKKYMRRDQVWFTSKDEDGRSSLYSLAEFKVRNDESFEKEYLGGVFGAIPILKDFSFKGDTK